MAAATRSRDQASELSISELQILAKLSVEAQSRFQDMINLGKRRYYTDISHERRSSLRETVRGLKIHRLIDLPVIES